LRSTNISVAIPIVLAIVAAIVFQPVTDWLEQRGMSGGVVAAAALGRLAGRWLA
jgi:predicted PurR-regulated permease PerM